MRASRAATALLHQTGAFTRKLLTDPSLSLCPPPGACMRARFWTMAARMARQAVLVAARRHACMHADAVRSGQACCRDQF
jgi:hypothetical protein